MVKFCRRKEEGGDLFFGGWISNGRRLPGTHKKMQKKG